MLVERRAQTLREIDERILEIRHSATAGLEAITCWHIARLESERTWIIDHSPGLERFYVPNDRPTTFAGPHD